MLNAYWSVTQAVRDWAKGKKDAQNVVDSSTK